MPLFLIYDGECPICSASANAIKIKKAVGELTLIDARSDYPLVAEVCKAGFDLDKGIVVKVGEQLYHGADALNFLALVGTESDSFNRMNVYLFRHKIIAKLCYPVFMTLRNLVLKINGVSRINKVEE